MKSFLNYLNEQNYPTSKTVDKKHQSEIEMKMFSAISKLESAYSDWKNIRINSVRPDSAFPVKISMEELKEIQKSLKKIANDIEIIADDISAGSDSVWNW